MSNCKITHHKVFSIFPGKEEVSDVTSDKTEHRFGRGTLAACTSLEKQEPTGGAIFEAANRPSLYGGQDPCRNGGSQQGHAADALPLA